MAIELKVPSVGESIVEVQIGRWLKQEGDAVAVDEPLVEIETDKVTQELPAPVAGRLGKILKQQGDTANVGDVIGGIEEGAAAAPSAAPAPAPDRKHKGEESAKAAAKKEPKPETTAEDKGKAAPRAKERDTEQVVAKAAEDGDDARVMPSAARILAQSKLKPDDAEATGPGGRVLKEDAQRAAEGRESAPPSRPAERDPAATGASRPSGDREEQAVPMSPMRRRIAQRLVQAQQETASLTTYNEVDMHAVMELRSRYKEGFEKKHGVKLGFMSFFVKASIEALKAFPAVNAEVRGTNIVYKNYYDIGIAIGGGKGLVVPVIRDADRLSMADVEKAIGAYAQKARDNKLALEDMQGGTFTITNGGVYGSMMSMPILNTPQSGILGMHAIVDRPMAVHGEVKIRPVMYVALTYDHRIVDGREAVSFLKKLKDTLEDPARLLLEV